MKSPFTQNRGQVFILDKRHIYFGSGSDQGKSLMQLQAAGHKSLNMSPTAIRSGQLGSHLQISVLTKGNVHEMLFMYILQGGF